MTSLQTDVHYSDSSILSKNPEQRLKVNATIAGLGVLIEKSFQPGRQKLEAQGIDVYALARIARLEKDLIEFY